MYICQYYAASPDNKAKIIALAELLGCQYRTVENIIAVQVDDAETLGRLERYAWLMVELSRFLFT
jgi:hypothetical protein